MQFNASWLASLEVWYHFRLCFSFSCSSYDLTLIKKTHKTNCYSFLQKFLLKAKTYKSLVTGVAQFTAKTANSEKAIYFLSLISCSVNKLVSNIIHMLKFYVFRFYMESKICSRKWCVGLKPPFPRPPFSTALFVWNQTCTTKTL